ncbi:hypothetical protein B0H16DRAFT_463413 [Mycena metata]|uniref:SET domain-containing protein n=1 Tax=Mycena metata TaxID=1033252 RepID=A0AAD7P037_9AGAR|nr:hypothetical protein B0H16DRAFT_463413 [Mycena metata]
MKRSFVKNSKAKASTGTVAESPLLASDATVAQALPLARFPIGKVDKVDVSLPEGYHEPSLKYVERDARHGSLQTAMTYTTVPNPFNCANFSSEPVSECFFFPGSKEVLMNLPNYPQPLVRPKTTSFHMIDVPGKGKGLFSTRALKAGDLILTERPLLVCARAVVILRPPNFSDAQYSQYSLDHLEKVTEIAVGRMRPEAKAAFMALANCHMEDGSGPLFGVVRTNGLSLGGLRPGVRGEMGTYNATCKDISRLNHSCFPNTASRFDMASFSYSLYAVRDIADGEELTYQYTAVGVPAAERKKALAPSGFVCTCTACTDAATSDARRSNIAAFNANLIEARASDEFLGKLLVKCRAQLELVEQEGLESLRIYWILLRALMDVHIWRGQAKDASAYAGKLNKMPTSSRITMNSSTPTDTRNTKRGEKSIAVSLKRTGRTALISCFIIFAMYTSEYCNYCSISV